MRRVLLLSLITISFASCAGRPPKVVGPLEECVSNPDDHQAICSSDGKTTHAIDYSQTKGWVMHTPETDKVIWGACILQRKSP